MSLAGTRASALRLLAIAFGKGDTGGEIFNQLIEADVTT